MATVSTTLPADGQTIDAADVNTPINAIITQVNGNIDADNIVDAGVTPNKLVSGTGTSWVSSDWTPTISQSGAVSITVNSAKYRQMGKFVYAWFRITAAGAGGGATAIAMGGLPVTAARSGEVVGSAYIFNADIPLVYDTTIQLASTSTANFIWGGGNGAAAGSSPSFTIATSDEFRGFLMYEAA